MINGKMLAMYLLAGGFGLFIFFISAGMPQAAAPQAGETEFKLYCSACHADGGNIINSAKTLSKADREKNGIKTAADIIKLMRNPGDGMSRFDEKTLPDKEARNIAEYILKTFK